MPTKTLIVPETHLENMLAQWLTKQGGMPEFRAPQCWSCGHVIRGKCWHVFFRRDQREAHLCRECGKPYEVKHVATMSLGRMEWHVPPSGALRKKMRDLLLKFGL